MKQRWAAVTMTTLLAGGVLLLTSCTASNGAGSGSDGLRVVATTTQLGDFTRNIVGDAPVEVTQLAEPNQSLHGFDPSAADLTAIGSADVVVINGGGLDSWIEDAIEASGFDGEVIDTTASIDLEVAATGGEHAGETEEEHAEHAKEPADEHAGETEAEPAEGGEAEDEHAAHDSGSGDPHVWHSATNAMTQVEAITTALVEADPDNAEVLRANSAAYLGKLEALETWVHENVDAVPADRRLLVTSHDAFGHLIADLGITFVGAVIPSTDDNAEASAAQLDELIAQIEETGATAVFAETAINPAAAETIATETGAEVYAGDRALYGDSLGPEGSAGETYVGSMVHNVSMLLESWGATPSPLPAELEQ